MIAFVDAGSLSRSWIGKTITAATEEGPAVGVLSDYQVLPHGATLYVGGRIFHCGLKATVSQGNFDELEGK